MNVLVTGPRGFVGRAACEALRRAGHAVVEAGRAQGVDFARDVAPAVWSTRLEGVDAVVNTVGILRDRPRGSIAAVHEHAPRALFEACAQAGVRRVIQVSALGIAGSPTAYARTKLAGERALLALVDAGRLDGLVVRPSIVFGAGGASSRMFLALAALPALLLPAPVRRTQVQPLAVAELGEAIARLVDAPLPEQRVLAAVGPQALPLGAFIASLRAQAGRPPARVGTLPQALARWSARAGDALPVSPWCSETLALLGVDNTAEPAPFERVLGRAATRFDQLLHGVAA